MRTDVSSVMKQPVLHIFTVLLTYDIDRKVCKCAFELEDTFLLSKLAPSDTIAGSKICMWVKNMLIFMVEHFLN